MLFDRCRSIYRRILDAAPDLGGRQEPRANEGLLEGFHQRDHTSNAESTAPPEEQIELCCIWAAELYTPAHTESLTRALRNFDQATQLTGSSSEDLASWFKGTQRHLYGRSAINLGIWAPKKRSASQIFTTRTVTLPDQVEYASGMMFSISPTLTCIVVQFVFSEGMSACYDSALKLDRETFITPTPRGSSIHLPFTQKADDIRCLRSKLSELVQTWFRENLPGAFSDQTDELTMPTCELVTFREAMPFPDMDSSVPPLYLRLLGLGHDWGTWKYSALPALRFGFHDPPRRGPRHQATLAINLRDWWEVDPNRELRDAKSALLSYVSLPIPELMSIWAVVPLLQGFAEQLVHIQNSTVFHADKRESHVEVLRQLTDYVSSLSDISAVSADLDEGARERYRPLLWGSPFMPVRPEQYEKGTTLDIALWSSIRERANWLRSTDRNIRDRLSQIGALVGVQEDVRLQKKVSVLTWVILIVTILALGTAVFQPLLHVWVSETVQQTLDQIRSPWAWRLW